MGRVGPPEDLVVPELEILVRISDRFPMVPSSLPRGSSSRLRMNDERVTSAEVGQRQSTIEEA